MKNRYIGFGLPGAGKTTLSERLSEQLKSMGQQVVLLDGDVLRTGLNNNLGFPELDRAENVRLIAEVRNYFSKKTLIAIENQTLSFWHKLIPRWKYELN
jgi:adenylylsulfate kinase